MANVPHLAMPFNFGPKGQSPQTEEQDSDAEIQTCVENIVRYVKGFREDLPEFGIPESAFTQQPIDSAAILKAIGEYEPRAIPIISTEPDKVLAWVEIVRIGFVSDIGAANG